MNIFTKLLLAAVLALGLTCVWQGNKIKTQDARISQIYNNYKYYESQFNGTEKENRVLQLTVNELKLSKDSLVQAVNKAKKELKVKDQNLKEAHVINTEMKDTTTVKIITKEVDFTKELKLNSLTTITVSRKDSILTTILDLKNQQILIVEEKKEYRNKYKNGWQRFWHFDWKKDKVQKYQIKNTNDLIKVTDTRVIKMADKQRLVIKTSLFYCPFPCL